MEKEATLPAAVVTAPATQKISWVYYARGLAILLIVYRHIVLGLKFSGVAVTDAMYDIQMLVFNFRMPAFFMLSGVFIAKSLKRKRESTVARDKANTLLYPYFVWAVITLILQIAFSRYANARRDWSDFGDIFSNPRSLDQLWYLLALFNASILYLFLHPFLKNRFWLHALIALALHFSSFYIQDYNLFSDFFYFYLFFFIGAQISDFLLAPEAKQKFFKTPYLLFVLPVFLIGQWYWYTHREATGLIEVLFILINLVGCYVLFKTAMLFSEMKLMQWMYVIGSYSLYVYILHVQVAAIVRKIVRGVWHDIDPWILLLICFVSGIVIPIVLVKSLRRFGFERLFTLKSKAATA